LKVTVVIVNSAERQVAVGAALAHVPRPAGILLRPWEESDFPAVQALSTAEGWTTPIERPEAALAAWQASWPALVATAEGMIIGFARSVSDGHVTIYLAEILVRPDWRGVGVGSALLDLTQRLCPGSRIDLLATTGSENFYTHSRFRSFPGFRRSWGELEER
jgi:GNAT superfamily N-acetyltransferase